MIENSLNAVFQDMGVDVVKTGMLTSAATIKTVAKCLRIFHNGKPSVVDPVMVSTSGSILIDKEAISTYVNELVPLATLITPNIPEARALIEAAYGGPKEDLTASASENKEVSVEDMKTLAKRLFSMGCHAVLVKGGHANRLDHKVIDILYDGDRYYEFVNEYIDTTSTHGTGCTLASAIASNLANNKDLNLSVRRGIQFVSRAVQTAIPLGSGHGPINHLYNIHTLPFVSGHFLDYLLGHPKVKPIWDKYVNHPFIQKLGREELDLNCFKYFLVQDYLYLRQYARCHSLAGFKADSVDSITKSAQIVLHVQEELNMHIEYCYSFGITQQQLEASKESIECFAYSRYILDIGSQRDWLCLQMALSPCLFGYIEAAKNVLDDPKARPGNRYWKWVTNYVNHDYVQAVQVGKELLETHVAQVAPQRIDELIDIFATATEMEINFWNGALRGRIDLDPVPSPSPSTLQMPYLTE